MGTMAKWNNHKFQVSSSVIRGFTGLTIKGSAETEDKKKNKSGYVSRKKSKPTEISLTIHLDARTGCNVRSEAMDFVKEAKSGASGYFYIGTKKLVSYKLMLTDADVKQIQLTSNAKWVCADVALTLKQCSKSGESSSGSSSKKKKKKSVKNSSPRSSGSSGRSSGGSSSSSSSSSYKSSSTKDRPGTPVKRNTGIDGISSAARKSYTKKTVKKTVSSANKSTGRYSNTGRKATTSSSTSSTSKGGMFTRIRNSIVRNYATVPGTR